MSSGIYKWENKITKSVYIGQAKCLDKRMKDFISFGNLYAGKLINQERQKYPSLKYWNYDVLEECSENDLDKLEKKWIKNFSNAKILNILSLPKKISVLPKKPIPNKNKELVGEKEIDDWINSRIVESQSEDLANLISILRDNKTNIIINESDCVFVDVPSEVVIKYNIDSIDACGKVFHIFDDKSWKWNFHNHPPIKIGCMNYNKKTHSIKFITTKDFYNAATKMDKNIIQLFHKTGLPLHMLKKALKENDNNVENAYYELSKKGQINMIS